MRYMTTKYMISDEHISATLFFILMFEEDCRMTLCMEIQGKTLESSKKFYGLPNLVHFKKSRMKAGDAIIVT